MGSLSVSSHRGLVCWQGLLKIVLLLNFWSKPTTAQLTVESKVVLEGMDVHLRILPDTPNAEGFLWYRGRMFDNYNHIAYLSVKPISSVRSSTDGHVMVEDDGSLLLKNVSMKDSGIYTVVVQIHDCQKMIACGRLRVYPIESVPTLEASKTTVKENKDAVVMTCHTSAPAIQWLYNGMSLQLTERMNLSRDHTRLSIDPVQREDAGVYQCKGFNPKSSGTSALLKLDVKFE